MVIAIDFDGTIVYNEYPEIGDLKFGAKKYINKLAKRGHEIIIWTCRSSADDLNSMYRFLIKNKIDFGRINRNSDVVTFGCKPKIYANVFIDDRNVFWVPCWWLIYWWIRIFRKG
jgi:hypothetical protein